MKYLLSFLFVFMLSFVAGAQSIRLKGTVYDWNCAAIAGAEALAVSAAKQQIATKSTDDGSYLLELTPGTYRLEFHAPGSRKTVWTDYMVVEQTFGAMNFDVVLFGEDGIEPCGYGGHCIEIPVTKGADVITTKRPSYKPRTKTYKKPGN